MRLAWLLCLLALPSWAQDVSLTWRPPTGCVDGSSPVVLSHYGIYRSSSEAGPFVRLPLAPLAAATEQLLPDELSQSRPRACYSMSATGTCSAAPATESVQSNVVCRDWDGQEAPGPVVDLRIEWVAAPPVEPPTSSMATLESTTYADGSGSPLSATYPGTILPGDSLVIVAHMRQSSGGQSLDTPSGWSVLGSAVGNDALVYWFEKDLVAGSETGSVSITASAGSNWRTVMIRVTDTAGVNADAYGSLNTAGGTTVASPTVTPPDNNSLVLSTLHQVLTPGSGWDPSAPSGMAKFSQNFGNFTNGIAIAELTQSTAEATGTLTWDGTGAFNPRVAGTLSFAPAAPSGAEAAIVAGAESDAGFSAIAHQPASLSAGAASTDQFAPIAHVAVSIVGAAASAETQGDAAAVLAAISAPATGDAVLDAIAQASAALTAGGSAGEAWVSDVQALADLIAGGAADETIAAQVTTPGATTITGISAAEAQFTTAVQALADVVAGGNAAAAMAAVASAIGALSAGAAAGEQLSAQGTDANARALIASGAAAELWSAVAAVNAEILESVGADALWTATAAVSVAVGARAAAGATFVAQLAGAGYVVVGAIRFLAAVYGRPSIRPAVTGTVKIKPH